ncbi:MAG: hypothetical protein V7711_07795 [Pseudomonadales bacterium]
MTRVTLLGVLFYCVSYSAFLAAENSAAESFPVHEGKHLLELAYTSIDGFDRNIVLVAPSYTYSYSRKLRFSATTQLMNLEVGENVGENANERVDEIGLGDSSFSIQYDPGENLTSAPWIPRSLGLFASVLIPTGDTDEGLSNDSWGGTVGAGWPIFLRDSLLLIPAFAYTKTFKHGEYSFPAEEFSLGASLVWVSSSGFWLGIEPVITRDMVAGENIDTIALAIGKSFRNGLGLELHWGTQNRIESFADRDDDILLFSVNWQFGRPPGH